jgi:hypothetical protein
MRNFIVGLVVGSCLAGLAAQESAPKRNFFYRGSELLKATETGQLAYTAGVYDALSFVVTWISLSPGTDEEDIKTLARSYDCLAFRAPRAGALQLFAIDRWERSLKTTSTFSGASVMILQACER